MGSVSAYIKGSIKEGGRDGLITVEPGLAQAPFEDMTDLYETVVFSDSTGISGDISAFAKSMVYSSVFSGESCPESKLSDHRQNDLIINQGISLVFFFLT